MKNKLPLLILIFGAFVFASSTNAQSKDTVKVKTSQSETVYETFDEPPVPPGGYKGYTTYLEKNIIYPDSAKKANASGFVYVSIIVNKDGSLSNVHVEKDNVHFDCGQEAVRVIKNMPPWTAGKINGKPVKVRYTIPVRFRLS